jgi:hypothetical protein
MNQGREHSPTMGILDTVEQALLNDALNVRFFPSKNLNLILSTLGDLMYPAAVIIYEGSIYKEEPSRTLGVSIVIISQMNNDIKESISKHLTLLDTIIDHFDYQIINDMKFNIQSDEPAQFDEGRGTMALVIKLSIEDN